MGAQEVRFTVEGHDAFVRLPDRRDGDAPLDWVWFAPVVDGRRTGALPGARCSRPSTTR